MGSVAAKNPEKLADATRQQAVADVYIPIVRPVLIPACVYYLVVTWEHWHTQSGLLLVSFSFISLTTALAFYLFHQYLNLENKIPLPRLELFVLLMQGLMYLNILSYLLIYNSETRYIFFVMLSFVFALTSASNRTAMISAAIPLATLYWFSTSLPGELHAEYVSIIVAAAFASLSMAVLLRRAIIRQIDARLVADELTAKAQTLADTDTLTGIPNRRAIFEEIDDLIERAQPFWLGVFDLDGFKSINDVYGHAMGDRLLRAAVDRVMEKAPEGVTIGRIGGDEFAAILPGNFTESQVKKLVGKRIGAITSPYTIDGQELTIGASAGFSHFPNTGICSNQLYEQADFALYKAKTKFRGQCVLFDATESDEMEKTVAIERELRECKLEEELYLLFQPQYSPSKQRVVSFEALARWQNPKLGLVSPDNFICVAERSGLIQNITRILFRKGLQELKNWPDEIGLSFNLSARDISNQTFVLSLLGEIMKAEISPTRVEFEITETAVMSDLATSSTTLDQLRASGCKIALDDFGSGYSSFGYLDQLPLDKIKIDKTFVRKVRHSSTSREIVAAINALCSKLDLRCVLEGVETEEEMALLAPLQPDLIQGYLFGRPMTAKNARELIASQNQPDAIDSLKRAYSA